MNGTQIGKREVTFYLQIQGHHAKIDHIFITVVKCKFNFLIYDINI